ncbi:unnamed protein product [Caretta caretta]
MFPYRVVSISLTCFSFLLILVVGVCPCWLLFSSDMGPMNFGIWTVCKGIACKNLPPRTSVLDSSRGFMLVGIITAIFATLCCLDSFLRQASKFFPETNVWAMTCFTAGVCGLISSVTFLVFVLNSPQQPQVQQKYNWAFYMSWAVGPAFALSVFPGLAEKLNFKRLTKVLTCLSLLTELLALVSPYWMEVVSPGFEASVGLWNICLNWFCSKLPMGTVAFEVTKALMTLSTLLGFIAVCSVLTSFHTFRKYRLAAVTNLLTGIVTLASVLVFRVSFSTSGPFHPELNRRHSWSFYVGCVASFLFLLSVAPGLAEKLNFKRLTKVLTCLSLLTELLALVSPYWMEVGSSGFETSVGLWNICINWFCKTIPVGSSGGRAAAPVAFEVTKALMTLSTLLGFIAVCSVLTSFHTFRKYRLAAVTNLLTGLILLINILLFGLSFSKIAAAFHPEMAARRGWSYYVACLAFFLFLLSGLLSLITHMKSSGTPTEHLNQVAPKWGRPWPASMVQMHQDQPRQELPSPV